MKQRPNKSKAGRKSENKKTPGEPALSLSPRRKWLFRFFALVVMPVLLIVLVAALLEIGFCPGGCGFDTHFFRSIRVGGQEYFLNNEEFTQCFFPEQLSRWPDPFKMPAVKSPDTIRIFIFGESAAMGDPQPAYGASRYMEVLLRDRFPGKKFEVINLGITAINSHVILPIARECARHDGDFWIVYMGNNEMVGPFGAATVFGAKAPPLGFVRLNLAIQKTRVGQLLVDIGRKLHGKNSNASWGGMKMFPGNQLRADDPRKEVVYQNFSRNLHDIVKAGLDSGAKILLNTVAVNLKDCAPFASLVNSNLPTADRAQFDQLFTDGVQAEDQGNFAEAAQKFESAAKLDPKVAELQFRWGESLFRLTNAAAAREHFQLACDDDALPFRADSRINAI